MQSRYYNPEIGRFINTDSVISTGQGVLGYNMFAYCNNNPVIRVDETGEFGVTLGLLAVGALIGVATQYLFDIVDNVRNGAESVEEIFTPSSSWADYLSAGISGALSTTGIGTIGSIVANAGLGGLTYLLNCDISGENFNKGEFLLNTIIGGGLGALGGKGANIPDLIGKYSTAKRALKTAVSNKKKTIYKNIIKHCKTKFIEGVDGMFWSGLESYGANCIKEHYY